jgi:hypothetical protein
MNEADAVQCCTRMHPPWWLAAPAATARHWVPLLSDDLTKQWTSPPAVQPSPITLLLVRIYSVKNENYIGGKMLYTSLLFYPTF